MKPKYKIGTIIKWNKYSADYIRAQITAIEYGKYYYDFIVHPRLKKHNFEMHSVEMETTEININYNQYWAKLNE